MGEVSHIELLALPRRQKIFAKTFLPAGDTLPVWARVSLDTKLPVPPSPRGSFTLYTNKIGEPKYKSFQHYDFDLSNPQGREAPGGYDSLTDPSLKFYFNSPKTRRHLVDNGLVTDNGEIKCSVKEFNEYREYIRYRSVTEFSLLKKQEKRIEEENTNRFFLEWPSIHKKKRMEKKERIRQSMSEPPRKESEDRLDMYRSNDELKNTKKKEKTNRKNDQDQNTQETNSEKESQNGAANQNSPLVEKIRQRELELNRRLEEQRRKRIEEHDKKVEESWKERQQRQQMLLDHEAEIESKMKEKRSNQIMDREKTLQHQRRKQDDKLQKIKQDLDSNKTGQKGHKNNSHSKGQEKEKNNNQEEKDQRLHVPEEEA